MNGELITILLIEDTPGDARLIREILAEETSAHLEQLDREITSLSDDLETLRTQGFPFVVVDPRTATPRDIAAVSASHFAGARSMARHLVELGHRRIGVLAGPHNWLAAQARLAGHTSALADVGVLPRPELVRPGEPTTRFGYQAASELLDLPERPTALVGFVSAHAKAPAAAKALLSYLSSAEAAVAYKACGMQPGR